MNQTAPKSLRLQIALCGKVNAGKSTFLNLVVGQQVSITSDVPGTTTDVVEKAMELLPLGPVLFMDCAGYGDETVLGSERMKKSDLAYRRADIVVWLTNGTDFGDIDRDFLRKCVNDKRNVMVVFNKTDISVPSIELVAEIKSLGIENILQLNSLDKSGRESSIAAFKQALIKLAPEDFIINVPLAGDLVEAHSHVILITPIDIEAPKGRLIMPQVQTIRDLLDHDCMVTVVKENDFCNVLANLKNPPSLVICDSQVVKKMAAETPENIPCTTFSILFSRLKGDLPLMARGAYTINNLKDGDKILIAEGCTHHAVEDDIGRVKIPRLIRQYTSKNLDFEVYSGHDYPEDLQKYALVLHCGGCMLNRRENLSRIELAAHLGIPITNYGMAISLTQGVLDRVLVPFQKKR
ncbi:MAG: [Lentisphaeria bacterium]|nr:[FeFe] hydrogenase H-cluster maturation GTPase HydF [Lentisphaeria bacterium]